MNKELEKAFEIVNRIRIDFFDNKYKTIHTDNEVEEKYEALGTILRYVKENSIPKRLVEEKIEEINEEFKNKNTPENNEWYLDSEKYAYAEEKLKDLLGEK